MKLYCATTNPGKLSEFKLAVETLGRGKFTVEPVPNLSNIKPCKETGSTFEENAVEKAVYYSTHADAPVFVDDSGLAVEALKGAPGIYSARYSGEGATDEDNNAKLLQEMKGQSDRRAEFICVVALAKRGRVMGTFAGITAGELLDAPRGTGGFGYDPLFYYPPRKCTFAELSAADKLTESHRGRALRLMLDYLRQS